MSWVEKNKTQLQAALNTALILDGTASNDKYQLCDTATDIIFSTFVLFSKSAETPEIFKGPEIASKFDKVFNVIEKGLHLWLLSLEPGENDSAKTVRSALQYLSDQYHGKFTEFLSSDFVEKLDEDIEICNHPNSFLQPAYPLPKTDLSHVPESHVWWLEEDRSKN